MEHIKKRKKNNILKPIILIFISIGIIIYAGFFPSTMKLLDEKINDILKSTGMKIEIDAFTKLSEFSLKIINTSEYWIDFFKDKIDKNNFERKKVPAIMITCAAKFPSESTYITSPFGSREDPFTQNESLHSGIDIAAKYGSSVKAAWPGKINETGFDKIYGNYVSIEHNNKFVTKYCHLSKICVEENDFVKAEEKIGEIGNSGRSTGSHLHFEVIINDKKIDPMECFEF